MKKGGTRLSYFGALIAVALFVIGASTGVYVLITEPETNQTDSERNQTQNFTQGTNLTISETNVTRPINLSFNILQANIFPGRIEFQLRNTGEATINGFLILLQGNLGIIRFENETNLNVRETKAITISPIPLGTYEKAQIIPRIVYQNGTFIYLYAKMVEYAFDPLANCGNNICDLGENNVTCPIDCLQNTTQNMSICGNLICEAGENDVNCAVDCFLMQSWSWPSSDSYLDYINDLDLYISTNRNYFNSGRGVPIAHDAIMTEQLPQNFNPASPDLVNSYNPSYCSPSSCNPQNYNAKVHYEGFLNYFLQNSQTVVGSYISGSYCRAVNPNPGIPFAYPIPQISCSVLQNCFLANQYWPQFDMYLVDISNTNCQQNFSRALLNQTFERKRPFIYFDNIVHPSSYGQPDRLPNTNIFWQTITTHLSSIKNKLNQRNLKLATNVAVSPSVLAQNNFRDADYLQNSVDGMSFELPFLIPYVRLSADDVQKEISVYRRWLANDKLVLLIPVQSDDDLDPARTYETTYMAALSMMIRNPGDSIFIARVYWGQKDEYIWREWTRLYGSPSGDFAFSGSGTTWSIQRNFANGKIGLQQFLTPENTALQFQALSFGDPNSYEILKQPLHGSLEINGTNVIYTPEQGYRSNLGNGKYAIDVFVLGTGKTGDIYQRLVTVGVFVGPLS